MDGFDINNLWEKLSLKAKNRWWRETDYNKRSASDELKQAMVDDAAANFMGLGKPDGAEDRR